MTDLGKWFERSGYTQREIAAKLGINESYLSRIVSGERQPSLALAVRIADLTGIPAAEMVTKPQPVGEAQ